MKKGFGRGSVMSLQTGAQWIKLGRDIALAVMLGLAAAGLPPRFTALLLAAGIVLMAVYLEPTLGRVMGLAGAPL
jgi:hypothetical protein